MTRYPTRYRAEAAARAAEARDGLERKATKGHPGEPGWFVVRTGRPVPSAHLRCPGCESEDLADDRCNECGYEPDCTTCFDNGATYDDVAGLPGACGDCQ